MNDEQVEQLLESSEALTCQVQGLATALTAVSQVQAHQAVAMTKASKRLRDVETVVPVAKERRKRAVAALVVFAILTILIGVGMFQYENTRQFSTTTSQFQTNCKTRNKSVAATVVFLQQVYNLVDALDRVQVRLGTPAAKAQDIAYRAFLNKVTAESKAASVGTVDCSVYR